MSKKRLTYNDRKQIAYLLKQGLSCTKIAYSIGKSKNCVVTEVRKNLSHGVYDPDAAQRKSEFLQSNKHEKKKNVDINELNKLIEKGLSLQEIASRLQVSKSTIKDLAHSNNIIDEPINIFAINRKIEGLSQCIDILFEKINELENIINDNKKKG